MKGYYEFVYEIDQYKGIKTTNLGMVFATGDKSGHDFMIRVKEGENPTDISKCSVIGYFIREKDNATVVINGFISDNAAVLLLPESCYTEEGYFQLIIKLVQPDNSSRMPIFCGRGYIIKSTTDTIVDPGHVIPSIEDLLVYVAEIENAVQAANQAAAVANKWNNVTATAQSVAFAEEASVQLSNTGDGKQFAFKIPRGEPGLSGMPGVSIGDIKVEIDNSEPEPPAPECTVEKTDFDPDQKVQNYRMTFRALHGRSIGDIDVELLKSYDVPRCDVRYTDNPDNTRDYTLSFEGLQGSRWYFTNFYRPNLEDEYFVFTQFNDAAVGDFVLVQDGYAIYRCVQGGGHARWENVGTLQGPQGTTGVGIGNISATVDTEDTSLDNTQYSPVTCHVDASGVVTDNKQDYKMQFTGLRGCIWNMGTAITGTNASGAVFTGSGLGNARIGDCYLNTDTSNVYICTLGGAASVAKWAYKGCIAGEAGSKGEAIGIGTITATCDNLSSDNPSCTVTSSQDGNNKNYKFDFTGLKGKTGPQGPIGVSGTQWHFLDFFSPSLEEGYYVFVGIDNAAYGDFAYIKDTSQVFRCVKENYTPTGHAHWELLCTLKGEAGPQGAAGTRGSVWNSGSKIYGLSTEGTTFPDSGLGTSNVGDYYLNTNAGYVYRCTVGGSASAAKWAYQGSIRGPQGAAGAAGTSASKLDCWPIGSVYLSVNDTSPASLFGGTWSRVGDPTRERLYLSTPGMPAYYPDYSGHVVAAGSASSTTFTRRVQGFTNAASVGLTVDLEYRVPYEQVKNTSGSTLNVIATRAYGVNVWKRTA